MKCTYTYIFILSTSLLLDILYRLYINYIAVKYYILIIIRKRTKYFHAIFYFMLFTLLRSSFVSSRHSTMSILFTSCVSFRTHCRI